MLMFLQPAAKPVVEGLEEHELTFGETQDAYVPLKAIRGAGPSYPVLSRWTLTPRQRAEVACGADIYLELLTFGNAKGEPNPLTPIRMAIGMDVDADYVRMELGI
jgi:hypothetical protein